MDAAIPFLRGATLRPSATQAARLVLPATVLVTLLFELALAERKYALFGGGFGQSNRLDAPLEIFVFLATILFFQLLFFYLLWRLVRRLHGRKASTWLFPFNFACFVGLAMLGFIIGRFHALAYFSDAMSFQIVRNLGGGSLTEALLYTLSEAGLALVGVGGFAIFYLAAWLVLRRRWKEAPPLPDLYRLAPGRVLMLLAGACLMLLASNRIDDSRSAVSRFAVPGLAGALLHPATDLDRDGWSWFSWPVDAHPFDAARHPYALDVPGNGIDEDGYGGDLAFTPPDPAFPPAIAGRKRHVVLIVLESGRADAIGRRVDGRPLTPVMDALAARGSAAAEAYSHVGFTTQSLQSLFTGLLAPRDDRQSLVRDFQANGYRVASFSGQSEDFGGIARTIGLRRGEIYVDANSLREERSLSFAAEGSLHVDGKLLLREFDRHLGRPEAWARPNFLYFNFQSAHFPYHFPGEDRILSGPPIPRGEISPGNRDWVARTYWNAIAYDDRLVGGVLDRLRRLGVLEDSLIVITADHGESLFDDGFLGHGHALNAQQTRIPFILSAAGQALPPVIGLSDMRGIILRAAGAPVASTDAGGVFQYLGELDRPGTIGIVEPGGRWTRFDLFREALWTHESQRWVPYRELDGGGRARANRLIDSWARQRWLRRLSEGAQG